MIVLNLGKYGKSKKEKSHLTKASINRHRTNGPLTQANAPFDYSEP